MKSDETDLLIRKVDAKLKQALKARAREHGRSLSDEAKAVLDEAVNPRQIEKMGTWLFNLVPPEDRGDDLVFEYRGEMPKPPDFE
jgi:Antitoxin FitA-like, ribbon-helix-helix